MIRRNTAILRRSAPYWSSAAFFSVHYPKPQLCSFSPAANLSSTAFKKQEIANKDVSVEQQNFGQNLGVTNPVKNKLNSKSDSGEHKESNKVKDKDYVSINAYSKPAFRFEETLNKLRPQLLEFVQKEDAAEGLSHFVEIVTKLQQKFNFPPNYFGYAVSQVFGESLKLLLEKSAEEKSVNVKPNRVVETLLKFGINNRNVNLSALKYYVRLQSKNHNPGDCKNFEEALSLYSKMLLQDPKQSIYLRCVGYSVYIVYVTMKGIPPNIGHLDKLFNLKGCGLNTIQKALDDCGFVLEGDLRKKVVQTVGAVSSSRVDLQKVENYYKLIDFVDRGDMQTFFRYVSRYENLSKQRNENLPEVFYTVVMQIHARLGNVNHAMNYWNLMIQSGITPSIESWNVLLLTVARKGDWALRKDKIEAIFEKIKPVANSNTYSNLMLAYKDIHEYKLAYEAFQQAEKAGKQNIFTMNTYLEVKAFENVGESYALFNEWLAKNKNYRATIKIINRYLKIYTSTRQFEKAREVIGKMEELQLKPDAASYSIIATLLVSESVKARNSFDSDSFLGLLKEMKANNISFNPHTLSSLIEGLMKDSENVEAGRAVFDLLEKRFQYNASVYTSRIKGEFSHGNVDVAIQVFENYIRLHNSKNVQMFNFIIGQLARKGDYKKALEYFYKIESSSNGSTHPNIFTYTIILPDADKEIAQKVVDHLESNKKVIKIDDKLKKCLKDATNSGVLLGERVNSML